MATEDPNLEYIASRSSTKDLASFPPFLLYPDLTTLLAFSTFLSLLPSHSLLRYAPHSLLLAELSNEALASQRFEKSGTEPVSDVLISHSFLSRLSFSPLRTSTTSKSLYTANLLRYESCSPPRLFRRFRLLFASFSDSQVSLLRPSDDYFFTYLLLFSSLFSCVLFTSLHTPLPLPLPFSLLALSICTPLNLS